MQIRIRQGNSGLRGLGQAWHPSAPDPFADLGPDSPINAAWILPPSPVPVSSSSSGPTT